MSTKTIELSTTWQCLRAPRKGLIWRNHRRWGIVMIIITVYTVCKAHQLPSPLRSIFQWFKIARNVPKIIILQQIKFIVMDLSTIGGRHNRNCLFRWNTMWRRGNGRRQCAEKSSIKIRKRVRHTKFINFARHSLAMATDMRTISQWIPIKNFIAHFHRWLSTFSRTVVRVKTHFTSIYDIFKWQKMHFVSLLE